MSITDEVAKAKAAKEQEQKETERRWAEFQASNQAQQREREQHKAEVMSDLTTLKRSVADPNVRLTANEQGVTLSWDQVENHPGSKPHLLHEIDRKVVSKQTRDWSDYDDGYRIDHHATTTATEITYDEGKTMKNAKALHVSAEELATISQDELARRFVKAQEGLGGSDTFVVKTGTKTVRVEDVVDDKHRIPLTREAKKRQQAIDDHDYARTYGDQQNT